MSKLSSLMFLIIGMFVTTTLLSYRSKANFLTACAEGNSNAKKNYNTYCVGCHGINLEGFVNRKWKNGNSKPYLIKTITKGYPDGSMPGSEKVLTKNEIKEIADYILGGIKPTNSK